MTWGPRWAVDWIHGMWRHQPQPPPDLAIPDTPPVGSRATGGDAQPPSASPPQPQHNEPPTNCGFAEYLRLAERGQP